MVRIYMEKTSSIAVEKWKNKKRYIGHFQLPVTYRNGNKIKPNMVIDYNQFISGIAWTDQMVSYYSIPIKTIRQIHLLDISTACWLNKNVTKNITVTTIYICNHYCFHSSTQCRNKKEISYILKKVGGGGYLLSTKNSRNHVSRVQMKKNSPVRLCINCFSAYQV